MAVAVCVKIGLCLPVFKTRVQSGAVQELCSEQYGDGSELPEADRYHPGVTSDLFWVPLRALNPSGSNCPSAVF